MLSLPELLADLVRLPSVNPMGRPLEGAYLYEYQVTNYLERFFRNLGIEPERQPIAPQRENIIARYHAPHATRTILFEVHQDTVPTDAMTIDPFGAIVENGRLYGRGACDVKGSLAAMLGVLARLCRERPKTSASLILACTVDEEHTFLGVQKLVQIGLQADFAIVAEPTRLNIVPTHKGVVRWEVTTTGIACHSSAPERGVNAIYRMGRLLEAIEGYAKSLSAKAKHPDLGTPTLSVGTIQGGVSVNTVPDRCSILVDRRLLPGEDPREAAKHFERVLREEAEVPFHCSAPFLSCPPLRPLGSQEAIQRLGDAINSVCGSHEVFGVPFGTDASTISEAGIPAIVFGPGDIAQAHTRDEWIELAQVEAAAEILYRLATQP